MNHLPLPDPPAQICRWIGVSPKAGRGTATRDARMENNVLHDIAGVDDDVSYSDIPHALTSTADSRAAVAAAAAGHSASLPLTRLHLPADCAQAESIVPRHTASRRHFRPAGATAGLH